MFDTKFFPSAKKFWYMGKFYEWQTPNIHCMSHVLHYGSSVFEGIRAYETPRGPTIFRLPEHIDRFFYSASVLGMKVPYTKDEIIEAIKLTIQENKLNSAYIRPLLFFSYGNLGLIPKACPVKLIIGAWEWEAYLGKEIWEKGAHVLILPWRRIHHSQIAISAKLGGLYVQSQIGGGYARKQGYDEGVFLNLEGNVAEGPGENILIVKEGRVKTNDKKESILEGITQTSLLEIATDLGYATEIGHITRAEFFNADEAFFSGTAVEIAPITKVTDDSAPKTEKKEYIIGKGKPGEITSHLAKVYQEAVRGKIKEYEKWLTYLD
ncbi:MAG: branched-chain amino acid transaminase [Candidatus Aminicenantia bacterium]